MSQRHLKVYRVVISILFLLLTAALFVDFRELIPSQWAAVILFLQFVPSVIKFITVPAIAATGFIIILILTALYGRVYCSVICPVGILQDVFAWIARHTGLVKRYKFKKALNYLRYPFLAVTVLFLLSGSLFLLNLLDPYSIFGRIFSDVIRPGIIVANNILAGWLEQLDFYFLFGLNLDLITWRTILVPVITLILIVWLSLFFGRLYCNTICPLGTVLGLLSRVSLFRISMDASTCTKCGKCSVDCKSSCISVKNLQVDFSRCVACYNCISVCPESSIQYELHRGNNKGNNKGSADISKRDFLRKTVLYGAALAGISRRSAGQQNQKKPAGQRPNKLTCPVTPPGSESLQHFTNRCTACHLCVTACPTGVLQPSFLEYGFTGMTQPHMDYSVEYCNFECTICGEVCPTGAIMPLTVAVKKLTQTGQVQFIRDKCIVYEKNTACGSCSEHCPTQAVKMVPYKGVLTIPETNIEICIGCGACEFACPVVPHKAIFVDGNKNHRIAKAPKIEEMEVVTQEEFPF
jgi:ferredoxin